jgi:uncharacterized protein (DUF2236 family)
MADYGFFGPDSVTWKVWDHATTPIIGLQRAVVVEELDPALNAAVDTTGANYDRPPKDEGLIESQPYLGSLA